VPHSQILFAMLAVPHSSASPLVASTWQQVAHNALRGVRNGALIFVVVYLLERLYKVSTSKYRSRNFFHDVCYWIYGKSDLPRFLFTAALFTYLSTHFAFLQIPALQRLPAAWRYVIWLVGGDFFMYWIHRWQHSNRFLWAFHSVHHSQERMTFATTVRFHPVDFFVLTSLAFLPMMPLGQQFIQIWLPIYVAMELLIDIQHSELPWKYGPFYRLVVSPTFHAFHHSTNPEHHNQHFGRFFSIWDYLFGTAVKDQQRPTVYGLTDRQMPTLWSQLWSPFVYVYDELRSGPAPRLQDSPLPSDAANPPAD
jgi:sterol desaturase/sphingolipid hydroxylase (fatty acid hydroxylase superfamily)